MPKPESVKDTDFSSDTAWVTFVANGGNYNYAGLYSICGYPPAV
jgi:hypothetical protein